MKINDVFKVSVRDVPEARRLHTAVAPNNTIIIFGGKEFNETWAPNNLVILDTTKTPYVWKIQNTTGEPPSVRSQHTMTIVGTKIIVAF
ncbi:hypothetical protein G9A89_005632, partial [Geosiphon pyriformis]